MRKHRIEWTNAARSDFLDIVGTIAADSPLNGGRIARRIDKAARAVAVFPRRCRRVPEYGARREPEIGESIVAPWRLMFRVDDRLVLIIAVVDGRRDLADWLPRRLATSGVADS